MVSFSCEGCGDVLTKKKLDAHRGQCRNASFVCLDCMTHFRGNEYKNHTSCISEDKKYQGHLYKEKDKSIKPLKKSVKISDTKTEVNPPRKAYVEDAPEGDNTPVKSVTVVEPPEDKTEPPSSNLADTVTAPVPPQSAPDPATTPAQARSSVSVFDFLVPSDTPPAAKTPLPEQKAKKKDMEKYDPRAHGSSVSLIESAAPTAHDPEYEQRGWSYGSAPIPATQKRSRPKVEYFTPAPKDLMKDLAEANRADKNVTSTNGSSTDKKRKRHNVEDLDLAAAQHSSHDSDAIMSDAPPAPSFSTGLTGGLNRLLSETDRYRRDERSRDDPPSPIKRPRPTSTYVVKQSTSSKPGSTSTTTSSALVRVKSRRSSDEDHPRKHHRSSQREDIQSKSHHDDAHHKSRHSESHSSHHRHDRDQSRTGSRSVTASSLGGSNNIKTIDRKRRGSSASDDSSVNDSTIRRQQQQVIVHSSARAQLFTSFVTKGPESELGCSMNKALKRYHRERAAVKGTTRLGALEKVDEEKELWRSLRLKKNERGEIVVFF